MNKLTEVFKALNQHKVLVVIALLSTARMRIEMGQAVLNRMLAGGVTIIRKLLYLFDD